MLLLECRTRFLKQFYSLLVYKKYDRTRQLKGKKSVTSTCSETIPGSHVNEHVSPTFVPHVPRAPFIGTFGRGHVTTEQIILMVISIPKP